MHRDQGHIFFSASDLADFVVCRHITALGLKNLVTPLPKKAADEETKILQEHGLAHERNYLKKLRQQRQSIADIPANIPHADRLRQTIEAMKSGADVVYQAAFESGVFRGYADFLLKTSTPSRLGNFSYEVADTKLARHGKARHLVQIALYSDLLEDVQGLAPAHAHLELGDATTKTYRLDDYRHYVAALKRRFVEFTAAPPVTTPEKCSHCGLCAWADLCKAEWTRIDHLNQVANIRAGDIKKLRGAGISTLEQLATTHQQVPGVGAFQALKRQADLQRQKRQDNQDRVVLKELDPNCSAGFYKLPPPDDGDLYFDMEGYPHEPGGLEYLFGVCYRQDDTVAFKPFWGHDRAGEKKAFEEFIDFVMAHLKAYPGAHIYHYADYERRALQKLMQVHGTREAEVDQILREQRLVDLYAVVRHAIMTSEPRYSIKNLETFYMKGERESDVKNAGASIVYYEHWRSDRDQKWLDDIERYNKEDCVSTEKLHVWLLGLKSQAETEFGQAISWHQKQSTDTETTPKEKSPETLAREAAQQALRQRLEQAIQNLDGTEKQAAQLLYHLLDFYWREVKPTFWKMFEQQEMTEPELIDDLDAIGGLTRDPTTDPEDDKRSVIYRYRVPQQEYRLKVGDSVRDTRTLNSVGTLHALDSAAGTLDLRIGKPTLAKTWEGKLPEVLSIAASGRVDTSMLEAALQRVAECRFGNPPDAAAYPALWDILTHSLPRVTGVAAGSPLLQAELNPQNVLDVVARLASSYLVIQGPPGTGKTYTGARVILGLLRQGKRIGVCATSHEAVANLLNAVTEAAKEIGYSFRGGRKSDGDSELDDDRFIIELKDSKDSTDTQYQLIGGTAWVFAREDADQTYDYLFIDEAGQVSLANLLAMGTAAKNIVLLGDQMQLGQPLQGTHPGDSGLSALEYLLRDHATVPPEQGILLNVSRRMHPGVCRFISDAVYEGRLTHYPATENQRLVLAPGADRTLRESGIVFNALPHSGCAQTSPPEAERVKGLIGSLLQQNYIDKDGRRHPLNPSNILVVAPYNAQVRLLKEVLPANIAVGTVDKFQGQEAEVVIVSMTTSSGEEMPRNMEFLFDRHRLNVAISRAKTLAIVLASPGLLEIDCSTPEQMALLNTLCWVAELGNSKKEAAPCR